MREPTPQITFKDPYRVPKFLWRFFSGQHLDGKARTNCTWTKPGNVPAHRAAYYWNRIPRLKRAAWRNGIFWPLVFILWGLLYYPHQTQWTLSACIPFGIWFMARRIVRSLTMPVRSISGTDLEEYRILRPVWKKRYKHAKGFVRKIRPLAKPRESLPETVQRAMLADNAEEHGAPILSVAEILGGEDELWN